MNDQLDQVRIRVISSELRLPNAISQTPEISPLHLNVKHQLVITTSTIETQIEIMHFYSLVIQHHRPFD